MRKTHEKLQEHLQTPIRYSGRFIYKDLANMVVCKDGFKMSVQASRSHYCTPRNNEGPYTSVEVWNCSEPVPEFGEDSGEPFGEVPVVLVCKIIDQHGGLI